MNCAGAVVSTIDLDPWGGETGRSSNQGVSTSSIYKLHARWEWRRRGDDVDFQVNWSRFAQPDPYDGSYIVTDPQSFNRYAYVHNDPVNFVDPSGLYQVCTTGPDGNITCREVGGAPGVQLDGGPIFYTGPRGTINDWRDNFSTLSAAHHAAGENGLVIVIARLGDGEHAKDLNKRRLHNARVYLTEFDWRRPQETVIRRKAGVSKVMAALSCTFRVNCSGSQASNAIETYW